MILIVDDVPGVIMAFAAALRRLDIPYIGVGSLAEARDVLPRHNWSAFILDLELPDGMGVDLLESLRAEPAYRHTPAAVITASILVDDMVIARIARANAGFHCGAFTKPEIAAICHNLVARKDRASACIGLTAAKEIARHRQATGGRVAEREGFFVLPRRAGVVVTSVGVKRLAEDEG